MEVPSGIAFIVGGSNIAFNYGYLEMHLSIKPHLRKNSPTALSSRKVETKYTGTARNDSIISTQCGLQLSLTTGTIMIAETRLL